MITVELWHGRAVSELVVVRRPWWIPLLHPVLWLVYQTSSRWGFGYGVYGRCIEVAEKHTVPLYAVVVVDPCQAYRQIWRGEDCATTPCPEHPDPL